MSKRPDAFSRNTIKAGHAQKGLVPKFSVTIESSVSVPDAPSHGRAIGIDLGFERFNRFSSGSFEQRPKFFKSMQRQLSLQQSSEAKKQKGSKNCQKAQIEVARMHHRIANRRKDFHLKTAHKLCSGAQTILAPDLNVKGLTRGMLRKDCVDAEEGLFLSLTEWVCWKRGVYFAKVNPNGTSQTCPACRCFRQ